jgi:O-antigen/teichoic acid export membrane protein
MAVSLSPATTMGLPRRGLSLRRSFSWSVLGNAIYAGCQWSMLVVLAKLTTPATLGQFSLALAITAPVFVCVGMCFRLVLATDARQEYAFGSYFGLWLISLGLAVLAVAGLAVAFGASWHLRWVILIVAAGRMFDSLSDLIYGLLLQHERLDRIATSRILQGTLQLVTFGIVLALTGALVWAVLGLTIVSGLVTAGYDVRNAVSVLQGAGALRCRGNERLEWPLLRPDWSPRELRRLTWLSLPLAAVLILDSLNATVPRYFVDQYLGKASLGHFTAVVYLVVAGVTVTNAVLEAARPRLARHFVDDLRAFRALLLKLVGAVVALGALEILGALLLGEPLLTLLYRRDYAGQIDLLVWAMVGAALWHLASTVETAVNAARLFRAEAPLHVATLTATTVSCLVLVPRYGLVGAAWALCLGMAARLAGTVIIMVWALKARRGVR